MKRIYLLAMATILSSISMSYATETLITRADCQYVNDGIKADIRCKVGSY